ncbi:hypothetical protein P8452_77542 [Trifolium repens]|jgi:hypothetical protein|nr:hypothetical protein P8452_77542 [Trifolium repens]
MKHLEADKLSHYFVKSIRKFIHRRMIELEVVDDAGNHQKKKWTPPEIQTLQDAIVVHGYKVKLIIKVNAYDNGFAEKYVKQIEKWMRKMALKALQNWNGGKNRPRGNTNGGKFEVVSPISIANMKEL